MSTMSKQLDPKTLEQLLLLMQGNSATNNGATQWSGTGDLSDWTVDRRRDVIGQQGVDGVQYSDPITRLYRNTGHETWGQDTANVFDEKGQYLGDSSGDSEALALAKFIAMSVGGYYAAGAANGMMGAGAGAGAGAGGAGSGAFLGEGVASGVGAWDAAALGAGNTLSGSAAAGGGALTAGAGGGGAGAGTGSQIVSGGKAALDAVGGAKTLVPLVGAIAGTADSKDRTDTTSRDPWAPAQPYLKGLLSEGADLYGKYKTQPFSQAQQSGYGNVGGLLDIVNSNAGGLLSGFQANAMGTNQFARGRPQQHSLVGSSFAPQDSQWNPGKYFDFGTRGK